MAFKTDKEAIAAIKALGYADVKSAGKKITVTIPDNARVAALETIAKKLKGKYNPRGAGSSIGRTEFQGGFIVLVKSGKGGSGAGSDITQLTESAQCVYAACHWLGLTYTDANLKKAVKSAPTNEKIDNIIKNLDKEWQASCILVAEKLKKQFNSKKYTFHRGDVWVDTLENHWKALNKVEKSFSNLNKWSPADIYMVSDVGKTIDITKTKNIIELNKVLLNALNKKDIIGVSLKKVKGAVNLAYKNIDDTRTKYMFNDYTLGKRGFFLSGDGYIIFEGGEIQFRTFGSTWQGEIKGKNANMGKISGGPIATILKTKLKIDMIPQSEIVERNEKNMKLFYSYYKALETNPKSYKDFVITMTEKDQNFYVSKLMTTQLMYHVHSLTKKKKDEFISSVLNYAGSESDLSGPYVKVY
jgi:hypothetical protein